MWVSKEKMTAESWFMSFPHPQQYTQALRKPAECFADPDLSCASVLCSLSGDPQPITGNFASVYRLDGGGRSWAVKCFLRNVSDQSFRYTQIQKHVARFSTENTINFEFLQKGINVGGEWHPVVKMEWVDGDPLDDFILKMGHQSALLSWLADQFKQMCRRLHKSGIAHGDLHHGNILVTKKGLRLVDYDGAFVPALVGLKSCELGHPNYQHPQRVSGDFSPELDNFSAWVIHTSLLCLSLDVTLWQTLAGGDECLLFRSSDFGNPLSSYAFALLENHDAEAVRLSARSLRTLCGMPPKSVPEVGDPIQRFASLPPLRGSITLPRWIPKVTGVSKEDSLACLRKFPGFRDFNEAMRMSSSFEDPELKQGLCLLEDTRVGANGRVYHFIGTDREFAVKCFSSDSLEREKRYQEISRITRGSLSGYVVDCEYNPRGVRVNGDWCPVLKMPWVRGHPISALPPYSISDGMASYLADQFAVMMAAFSKAGIAHGDLELSNLIFDTEAQDLKVVDYDNMFVPVLTRLGSLELGHPGYQSPRRTLNDYGPYVDNFAAWLIHYILKNLAINRRLPELLEMCLEEERQGSMAHQMLKALVNDREGEVRQLGKMIHLLLARPLHFIPELSPEIGLEEVLSKQSKEVTKGGGLLNKRRSQGL
jgi:serine/threonine protein kinase